MLIKSKKYNVIFLFNSCKFDHQIATMNTSGNESTRRVYALSEITESITRMFEKYYDTPYWIKAEISALNLYPVSGHCFPLMVEKSDGKVKAQLKAVIWKDDLFYITQKFEEVTRETFREGLNIMFYAYIKFSSTYGLSLQIIDIEPLFTLGEMARDKMNTISALKNEGVFDNNRQITLPVLLKRLAIISVASSKGYNDLMVTLQNNKQGYRVISRLFPAVLQGKGAVESITGQLRAIHALAETFDAVAIVRGGGDDVGLSCYDNLDLAREVAMFPIPVITGIGHSTNETVVEMVACVNKITPTDVAHFILSGFLEQDQVLQTLEQEMINGVNFLIQQQREWLENNADIFSQLAGRLIFNNKVTLSKYNLSIGHYPQRLLKSESVSLENQAKMLLFITQHYLTSHQQKLEDKNRRLRILDPQNVMKRGYSIIRIAGKVPERKEDVHKGEQMEVETYRLKISGTIRSAENKEMMP